MNLINGRGFNWQTFYYAYQAVMDSPESSPRGQLVRDLRGATLIFDLNDSLLTSFVDRKLNLTYCKREWLWYIGADPYDDSIQQYAQMWAKLKQPDGRYFSNYGHYIFGGHPSQFDYVVDQLTTDRDSRRASMVLLERDHLFKENVDTVCTYAINFAIVQGRFNMTVHMRSNDVVFGLTNDAFAFWQLAEFVFVRLLRVHPDLIRGSYTHIADSLHVYERHFDMLDRILRHPVMDTIEVPRPSYDEVMFLTHKHPRKDLDAPYIRWLTAVD